MKRWWAVLVVLSAWLVAAPAYAESVAELAKKLLDDGDFRVRTQAALALGASGSSQAVAPLCKGIDDGNETVRAAVAAGLGRLAKGGKDCLERRKSKEKSRNVLKMIDKALTLIADAAGGPSLGSAKYYLSIGKINVRGSKRSDIAGYTRNAMQRALSAKSGFAFAPAGESKDEAKKRLRKYPHVAGYALQSDVSVEYSGGNLTVALEVAIYGYPDMDSQGSLSHFAGDSASSQDDDKENALLDTVVKKAMNKFASMAASVD